MECLTCRFEPLVFNLTNSLLSMISCCSKKGDKVHN